MIKAVYAGSFDPITNGHLDIIKRASTIFDLTIIIANNSSKKHLLTIEERIKLVKESTLLKTEQITGLLSSYCKENNINIIIRGLRNSIDFEYEFQMAHINNSIFNNLETIFIPSKGDQTYISSSMIRELLKLNADISKYVPSVVNDFLSCRKFNI